MGQQGERSLSFGYQFAAGAIAGVSELLAMYPLDVVKTRMQLQVGAGKAQYTGVLDCLSKIVKREGFSRLYKGITSPILMEAPKRATKFACNEQFGNFYKSLAGTKELTQPLSILSGASAGVVESFVVVPFELVKIRLQDVSSQYKGPVDVVRQIISKEGYFAMYNGLEATMWRHGVWNAGYFGIIFQVRQLLPQSAEHKTRNDLIAGTVGGTMGSVLNIPFDVVKSRIQNGVVTADGVRKYNWACPSVMIIYKEEGFRALYKGLVPKILRLGPGGGILLVVFTNVMEFFKDLKYGKQ